MTSVLVICFRCKRDIRPLSGDKYTAVRIGDRWRPVCLECKNVSDLRRNS